MKTIVYKTIICVLMLTSGLSNSQGLQLNETPQELRPIRLTYKGIDGVFISLALMDTVSLKLIDRKSLIGERLTFMDLIEAHKREAQNLELQNISLTSSLNNWQSLYLNEIKKHELTRTNYDLQKDLTAAAKQKARRNGLYWFGGGIITTLAAVLVLSN